MIKFIHGLWLSRVPGYPTEYSGTQIQMLQIGYQFTRSKINSRNWYHPNTIEINNSAKSRDVEIVVFSLLT